MRLLYISNGPVPPSPDGTRDKFTFLSEVAEGEILLPIWARSQEKVPAYLRPTFPVYRVGNFSYHLFLMYRYPAAIRPFAKLLFFVRRGLQLHRIKKIDVIMTYGTNATGVAGLILKWLTGAKLIPELPNVPENSFRYQSPDAGSLTAAKRFLADRLLNWVCKSADCIRLFYPWQLRKFPQLEKKKVSVFHEFVPVHEIPVAESSDDKFVLLAGYPWYTKGVDVLIRAFVSIAKQFPDYKLKLLGYYPNREYLNQLAGGCPQIEFLDARSNELALKVIASCSVYVLASRTDAAPRVLLEAMAARKPIIASAVGGVPHYIKDNENGFLFGSENVEDLAEKLSEMLNSSELRARLAVRGYQRAMSEFDERSYVRSFKRMLMSLGDEAVEGSVLVKDRKPAIFQ